MEHLRYNESDELADWRFITTVRVSCNRNQSNYRRTVTLLRSSRCISDDVSNGGQKKKKKKKGGGEEEEEGGGGGGRRRMMCHTHTL